MTPQEWIEKVAEYEDAAAQTRGIFLGQTVRFAQEGAQHLAAALEEIARLQVQLSQAERVVVPELTSGVSFWRHANGAWYCWNGWKNIEMTQSRVLKDGEVAVRLEDWDSAREWEFDGMRIHKLEFEGGFRFCVKRGDHLILGRSGAWDYDRLPSSRDEEFFREFRFDSFRAALDALRAQGKEKP